MNHEQQKRYSRNTTLPHIGYKGQEKLLSSKVLVVGAGGLGCPALLYLTASGIGTLGIIDSDRVELSNLQRQILYESSDIGEYKCDSAKEALHDLNPDINIECHNIRLDKSNIDEIISGYDLIIDGTDNIETRLLLNDSCYKHRLTLVSAAIHGFIGHLYVFKAFWGKDYPCYRCIFPAIEGQQMPDCSESGVMGSVAGVMGSMLATEAIKELLDIEHSPSKNMVIYDALNTDFRKVTVKRNKGCICCG
ncbi:MAG: adenylyltransferase [Alphaproteobacteria bacterium CG11_big_fil_rev_8_21_14_0_20_39_49]|nr:MAG: adenylyltransferase [Alphaproteobacteria bacterium CG11_big_fil_rev_8_21_14_0_20_39_49]